MMGYTLKKTVATKNITKKITNANAIYLGPTNLDHFEILCQSYVLTRFSSLDI